jgi:predicted nucleic acid-binding protein
MNWRRQARVAQADNRMEMATDEDFYDGIQLGPEDLHVLTERNQPPLVFNVTKNTINWMLGTERQARIDSRVLPRKKAGADTAKTKTKLMKYTSDTSRGEYEKSQAFESSIKAGLGWLENGVRSNDDEPIFMRQERWRNMWYDHLGLSLDGSDWRFEIREKWVDLDIAIGMFPEREDRLKVVAEGVNSLYPYLPDDAVITDVASEFDLESDLDSLFGGNYDGMRERLKLVETWYRVPDNVKILKMRDEDTPYGALNGAIFRPTMADHQYLVRGGYFTLTDARILTVRQAIWAGGTLLQDDLTPYNHNRFPFVPMFCYRRQRDNMPYGVIRDLRDPQSDLNKRRSRALFRLTSNRIIAEEGAVNDKKEAYEEVNKPDGYVEVKAGKMDKFKIQDEKDLASADLEMSRDDERFIESISGVTPENKGTVRKDLSGKAIQNIQEQGHTTSAVPFDNYYLALQLEGETRLSLIEQFYDKEKEYRVTGDENKDDFVKINEKKDGKILNNITESKADYIVSKQSFKDTLRQSMLATFMELITNFSKSMPNVALALLDQAFELMDELSVKDEVVARIRKINGQQAPEDEQTPEEKEEAAKQKQVQEQKQQQDQQIQQALIQAKLAIEQNKALGLKNKADKDQIDGAMVKLQGFLNALEVAGVLKANPDLAAAADNIFAEAAAAPIEGQEPRAQNTQQT